MDVIDIVALILVLINFTILIPIMLFGLCLLDKHKNNAFIQHRNPTLIYILTILTVLTIAFERTFVLSVFVWNIIAVKAWIVYFVLSIPWWALFALFAIKVYTSYYQQQYNLSILDRVWKSDINPQTVDFYITNRHKWGSAQWLMKLCFIPYVISCASIAVLPQFFGEGLMDFFQSVAIFPPICASFFAVNQARKLRDAWSIREETLYQSLLIFPSMFVYMIAFAVTKIPSIQQTYGIHVFRFNTALYSLIAVIGAVAFGIIPILYPIYLIKKTKQSAHSQLITESFSGTNGDAMHSVCWVNNIMAHYESFQLFMKYLVSEFTAENALFLVELIQIKHEFQKRNEFRVHLTNPSDDQTYLLIDFNLNPIDGEPYKSEQERYFTYLFHQSGTIRAKISLPIEVPRSVILVQYENDLHKQMRCLYNKYIAVERLNISYKVVEELDAIFLPERDSIDDHVLFNAMDECASDILVLLRQSFARLISTNSFASKLEEIKCEWEDKYVDIPSDIKMKKLLNSNDVPILTKKELIHYYN